MAGSVCVRIPRGTGRTCPEDTENRAWWCAHCTAEAAKPVARILVGRRVATVRDVTRPGDYCGPVRGYTGDLLACFFLKPNARHADAPPGARSVHHVCFPPHTYRECDDGSLEIRASIADHVKGSTVSDGWHGFLDEGHVWRQV